MNEPSIDASYSEWAKEASIAFRSTEEEITSKDVISLKGEDAYLKELWKLIYLSSKFSNVPKDDSLGVALFISFLLKSTLFFDFTFSKGLTTTNAKLVLIYGDLYLAQGGIEFSNIKGFEKGKKELRKTLKNIALSQKLESIANKGNNVLNFNNYKKLIKLRYASIFRLSLIIPFLIGEVEFIPKRAINYYSTNIALLISLTNNKFIKSPLDSKEKNKKISKIKDKSLKYLGGIFLDELYINGWKENSSKT